jgi:hypothetical protein
MIHYTRSKDALRLLQPSIDPKPTFRFPIRARLQPARHCLAKQGLFRSDPAKWRLLFCQTRVSNGKLGCQTMFLSDRSFVGEIRGPAPRRGGRHLSLSPVP